MGAMTAFVVVVVGIVVCPSPSLFYGELFEGVMDTN
jgi:hypothetical protein